MRCVPLSVALSWAIRLYIASQLGGLVFYKVNGVMGTYTPCLAFSLGSGCCKSHSRTLGLSMIFQLPGNFFLVQSLNQARKITVASGS